MGNTKERKEGEAARAPQTSETGGRDVIGDHGMEKFPDDSPTVARGWGGLAALTPRVQGHMSGGSSGPVMEDLRAPSSRTREWGSANDGNDLRNEEVALESGPVDLDRGHAIRLKAVDASP